jgi:arylsulfatase A-like enzyme
MAVNFSIYPGAPWRYAPGDVFEPSGPKELPPTLASILKDKGWRTAYMHNGDLEWGGESVMLDNSGYDTVEDYKKWNAPQLTSWGTEDRFLFDHLIQWIDEKPGQPFLAYCWTDQTHNPYAQRPGTPRVDFFQGNPPKEHAEALSKYLNVVHETDKDLGRLFAALRERGIADDTLVVVTGDHGEAFADPHDQQGHGFTVYEEEVHVPFMIWNPRLFPEGGRPTQLGGHVDLNPTVADLLGVPIPDEWQGYSLFASERPDRTFFVASVDDYFFGVREGRWKYIFESSEGESLFDLSSDPTEQHNLITAEPALGERLRQRVAGWLSFEDKFLCGKEETL